MSTNLKKKSLLPLIAMVLVSVVALSSVTYAWFTTSNTATVSDLNVNVESAAGIQISLDAANWKSSFTMNDIKTANITGNQIPESKIYPVSSAGNASAGRMAMFLGTLDDNDKLDITQCVDGSNSNYIAFDLFFKIAADDTVITLDGASSVTESGNGSTIPSVNSARVAFVNFGCSDSATGAKNLQNPVGDTVIWEPVKDANVTYNGLTSAGSKVATENGVVKAGTNAAAVTTVNADDVEITLDEGFNKVRIYIWMEGQDVDCTNDASGGAFNTVLKFSQPTPAAGN